MENIFAIVSDGKVKNVIVAKLENIGNLKGQAIDVTNVQNRPGPGWLYDGKDFSEPTKVEPEPKLEPDPKSEAAKYLRALDIETIPVESEELKQLLVKIIEAIV